MDIAVESNGSVPADVFVVVPSFNHADFIEDCLGSIFLQTLPPKKLLVIDDGSKDDSPKLIENLLKQCPFDSELIVRENQGLCRTLNQGFSLSSGEYFAYIGSDDFWLPEFLEARASMLNGRPDAVLGYGHSHMVDENGEIFDSTTNYTDTWANYPNRSTRSMLINGIVPTSSSVVYRRAALENVRWNEDARLEDYEMYVKLINLGEFAFAPRILSVWRQHRSNTSGNRFLLLNEILAAQERNLDQLRLTREELRLVQSRTKFRHARIELQYGEKLAALRLARTSWRSAESFYQVVKFGLRLLVPMAVVNGLREKRRRGAITGFRQGAT